MCEEEEVLEKCKVDEAKKAVHQGQCELLELRIVKKRRRQIDLESGMKTVGRYFSHGSENSLQRNNSVQAGGTEEEGLHRSTE